MKRRFFKFFIPFLALLVPSAMNYSDLPAVRGRGEKEVSEADGDEKKTILYKYEQNDRFLQFVKHSSHRSHSSHKSHSSHTSGNHSSHSSHTSGSDCSGCDNVSTNDYATHTHTFSSKWTYDEESHWHDATCSHEVIDSYGPHDFSDWEIVKYPTVSESGKKIRECKMCGFIETQYIWGI